MIVGIKAIGIYAGNVSAATILKWKTERDFPASKIDGTWRSSKTMINKWNQTQICLSIGLDPIILETRPETGQIETRENYVKRKVKHLKSK